MSEEAFFTEALLFHTITIDEGHRLKNENSMLCASLVTDRYSFSTVFVSVQLLHVLPSQPSDLCTGSLPLQF